MSGGSGGSRDDVTRETAAAAGTDTAVLGSDYVAPDLQDTVTGGPGAADRTRELAPGTTFDRYTILELLGRGGMGAVYKAYDPRLDRAIALKVIATDAGDRDSDYGERLVREARALAQLSHPNVVAVYDVGTHGDDVYMSLELVEGRDLRHWLRAEKRTPAQILEVMHAAGAGLAAAHRAGLLHRDFKPHNVLVGDDGRVRVADFGLARPAERELDSSIDLGRGSLVGLESSASQLSGPISERLAVDSGGHRLPSTHLTRTGALVGTPAYMAPEQLAGDEVDERADQFAFCVTLYEALFGRRPFRGKNVRELRAAIDGGELRAPLPGAHAPAWLARVVKRGLSPRPDERFESMDALLAALRRDPAIVRRRLARVGGVAALAGLAVFGWLRASQQPAAAACDGGAEEIAALWSPAVRQEVRAAFAATGVAYAASAFERADAALVVYLDEWAAAHRTSCQATYVKRLQSDEIFGVQSECLARRRAEAQALIEVFRQANATVVEKAASAVAELDAPGECAALMRRPSGVPMPEDPAAREAIAAAHAGLAAADAAQKAGLPREALAQVRSLLPRVEALAYVPLHAETLETLGTLQDLVDEYAAAKETLAQAVLLAARAQSPEIEARAWNRVLWLVGVRDAAPDQVRYVRSAAEAALVRAGGPAALTASHERVLAGIRYREGDYRAAETHLERAVALSREAFGEAHPRTVAMLSNLATAIDLQRDYQRARPMYERAIAAQIDMLGERHPDVARSLTNLGGMLVDAGEVAEAVPILRRAVAAWTDTVGADHLQTAHALTNLGAAYQRLARRADAEAAYRRALTIRDAALPATHPDLGIALQNLGSILVERDRHREGLAVLERALVVREAAFGAEHVAVARTRAYLALAEIGLERHDAAIAHAERALSIHRAAGTVGPALAEALFVAARAQVSRDRQTAVARAAEALALIPEGQPALAPMRDEIRAWLQNSGAP